MNVFVCLYHSSDLTMRWLFLCNSNGSWKLTLSLGVLSSANVSEIIEAVLRIPKSFIYINQQKLFVFDVTFSNAGKFLFTFYT